jgi:hypothetical protein
MFYFQSKSIEGNLLSFRALHVEDKLKEVHEYSMNGKRHSNKNIFMKSKLLKKT